MHLRYVLFGLVSASTIVAIACSGSDDPLPLGAPDAAGYDATANYDSSSATDSSSTPDVQPVDTGVDAKDSALPCPIDANATISASIKVTADDFLKLWVNGTLVDDKQTTWGTVDTKDITLFRSPLRKNVIAVEVRNAYNAGGLDRGLLVDLSFPTDAGADSGIPAIVTDTSWKMVGTNQDGGVPDGGLPDGGSSGVVAWFDPAFVDTSWSAPTDEGAHGISPWGAVFGASSAHWLWSYDSATASSKPESEFVYFRKAIYFNMAGAPQGTPASCP
jgi:hypothetical protein